jgi:hypothetical protein
MATSRPRRTRVRITRADSSGSAFLLNKTLKPERTLRGSFILFMLETFNQVVLPLRRITQDHTLLAAQRKSNSSHFYICRNYWLAKSIQQNETEMQLFFCRCVNTTRTCLHWVSLSGDFFHSGRLFAHRPPSFRLLFTSRDVHLDHQSSTNIFHMRVCPRSCLRFILNKTFEPKLDSKHEGANNSARNFITVQYSKFPFIKFVLTRCYFV